MYSNEYETILKREDIGHLVMIRKGVENLYFLFLNHSADEDVGMEGALSNLLTAYK